VETHYPGCSVHIAHRINWSIDVANSDPSKISTEQIRGYFAELIESSFPSEIRLKHGLKVDFRRDSVCLENWRDIYEGRIQELIDDASTHFETNKVGAFGFLQGTTKPGRLNFVKYAQKYPGYFKFIETEKYSKDMKGYLSLLDYKRKFKYIIDLPGHTYSTKSYWMLFLKRPMFYVEPILKFNWESNLKPWVHYIPVKRDYSDLLRHYEWAEGHPDEVQSIAANLYKFGAEEMHPTRVLNRFKQDIRRCLY